jgi:hypothetical protein
MKGTDPANALESETRDLGMQIEFGAHPNTCVLLFFINGVAPPFRRAFAADAARQRPQNDRAG